MRGIFCRESFKESSTTLSPLLSLPLFVKLLSLEIHSRIAPLYVKSPQLIIFAAMAQKKLLRFAQLKTLENVKEYPEGMPGKWKEFFKNDSPVVLERACGRGEYTAGLAAMHPGSNFLGVDVKGNRMYLGAKYAIDNKLQNAGFLRTQIEMLGDYFAPGEVDEIWITFPDPQPQLSREKKRLTSPRFLNMYQPTLKEGGCVNLKTDNDGLYEYTVDKIAELKLPLHIQTDDLYHSEFADEVLSIKTYYEKKYLKDNKNINYVKFSFQ